MKGCFTTLLLALIFAVFAAFFGRSCHHQDVESILTERVANEISTTYPGVDVEYDNLTAVVKGNVTESKKNEIKEKVQELALGNGRVHFVGSETGGGVLPVVAKTPSNFTIFRDNNSLTLNGTVNGEQTSKLLEAEARKRTQGLTVTNNIEVGKNTTAFPAFGSAIAAAPVLMEVAKDGRLEVTSKEVKVSGTVANETVKSELLGLFAGEKWPEMTIVENIKVLPAPDPTIPMTFTVLKNSQKLILTGAVDSEETRTKIGNSAALEGFEVDNQITVSKDVMPLDTLDSALAGIAPLVSSTQNGKIEFSPDRVVLGGLVNSKKTKTGIIDLYGSGNWPGAIAPKVVDNIRIRPSIPSKFTIEKQVNRLVLNGLVDSPETRTMIGNSAKLEGFTVDNQIKVSEEVLEFPDFKPLAMGIPAMLNATEKGKISFTPEKVVLDGTVKTGAVKNEIAGAFGGINLENNLQVMAPKPTKPSNFTIEKQGDRLVLNGVVDSPETRTMIGNSAKLEGFTVDNQIKVSEEVVKFPDFKPLAMGIPAMLNATEKGKISFTPEKVVLDGTVKTGAVKNEIAGAFGGMKLENNIQVMAPTPPTKPSNFLVEKSKDKIVLTGTVDSQKTKRMIGNLAKMEGVTVDNKIKVSPEHMAFPNMEPMTVGIPSLIKAAEDGKIAVTPEKVTLDGVVNTTGIKDSIAGSFGELNIVNNMKVMSTPEPPTKPSNFTIVKTNKKMVLTGSVDSAKTKETIGNLAKVEGLTVDNQIKVDPATKAFPDMKPIALGIPSLIKATNDGKIAVTPDQVELDGLVNTKAIKDNIAGAFSGIKIVNNIKVKPPKTEPTFSWKQTTPKKAVLTGKVPNAQIRKSLVDAAKKRLGADGEVVDQMQIDANVRNAPWLKALPVFATQAIPKVNDPVINIDNKVAKISGTVPSSTVMNDVSLAFSGINPPGKLDIDLKVVQPSAPTPPPAPKRDKIPGVELTGKGNELSLVGSVPNKKTHDSIVNTILGVDGIGQIKVNSLKVANDVQEDKYLKELPVFVGNFYNGKVREREFWLKNRQLTLKGVVPSKEAKIAAVALANPLKKAGVKVIDLIKIDPPKVVISNPPNTNDPNKPPTMVKDPNKPGTPKPINPDKGELHSVYFGTGEFHIRSSQSHRAKKLLDRAKVTKGKIVIDGFADERGSSDLNAFLSDERAKRIRIYLIENGIDPNRIISVLGRGAVAGNRGQYQQYRRTDVRIVEEK